MGHKRISRENNWLPTKLADVGWFCLSVGISGTSTQKTFLARKKRSERWISGFRRKMRFFAQIWRKQKNDLSEKELPGTSSVSLVLKEGTRNSPGTPNPYFTNFCKKKKDRPQKHKICVSRQNFHNFHYFTEIHSPGMARRAVGRDFSWATIEAAPLSQFSVKAPIIGFFLNTWFCSLSLSLSLFLSDFLSLFLFEDSFYL